ncbi:hypothetical protein [Candidatus Protofrankia californiensis]|uniref:hypothetical protein n=1 Tax=Candidatus Protofrankia californiensis TaxID=1839754 RepID=UPI001040E29B|nr:hypothetical protein [Candidatus Protofrankia californiensis]
MKKQKDAKVAPKKVKLLRVLGVGVVIAAVLALLGYFGFRALEYNYARDDAQPLEAALVAKGAKKLCSREDNGRGWDNKAPWYYAIFEVPGDRQAATDLALNTMKEAGFTNFEGSAPPAKPDDINTYTDTASQKNTHSDLKAGAKTVSIEVFYDSIYPTANNPFCGVENSSNPPTDKTLVRFTLGLPEYK